MMFGRSRNDRHRSAVTGLLDIGTSKVAAAVLATGGGANGADFRVAGLGMHRSRGVKAGVLTDLDAAESAVREAIGQAERAAGLTLSSVVVSLSCGRLKSQHFAARTSIENGQVANADISRVNEAARAYAEREGRLLVHLNRLGYRVDGAPGGAEVRGLMGHTLSADLHAVTADEAPLRNLLLLIERCHLACEGMFVAPFASALAVTSPEERELGVTCIDLGAGTASIALFVEGKFAGADVVPVGSQHITFDIARALQTRLADAERLKTLYGTLIPAHSDEHEILSYTLAGDGEGQTHQTTKARLTAIIRPRLAQIFALVRERLEQNPASAAAGDCVVLTGGASQLLGMMEFATRELHRQVRLGRPSNVAGLPQSVSGAHFSSLAGLALATASEPADDTGFGVVSEGPGGYLNRVGSWLRASF